MNSKEYENYQLALIAQSYIERGFEVAIWGRMPNVNNVRFDAIALGPGGEVVIIELVNKRQSYDLAQSKVEAFKKIARENTNVKVDFRYIDVEPGVAMASRSRGRPDDVKASLERAVNATPPILRANSIDINQKFITLWLMHASLIRDYWICLDSVDGHADSVLNLYNELLRADFLVTPESIWGRVKIDLFELYDEVQGVIQGGIVDRVQYQQLRLHVRCVQQQVKRYLGRHAE